MDSNNTSSCTYLSPQPGRMRVAVEMLDSTLVASDMFSAIDAIAACHKAQMEFASKFCLYFSLKMQLILSLHSKRSDRAHATHCFVLLITAPFAACAAAPHRIALHCAGGTCARFRARTTRSSARRTGSSRRSRVARRHESATRAFRRSPPSRRHRLTVIRAAAPAAGGRARTTLSRRVASDATSNSFSSFSLRVAVRSGPVRPLETARAESSAYS